MTHRIVATLTLVAALALAATLTATNANRNAAQMKAAELTKARVARGEYLVGIGGCNDCHTPLKMTARGPEPDFSRRLPDIRKD